MTDKHTGQVSVTTWWYRGKVFARTRPSDTERAIPLRRARSSGGQDGQGHRRQRDEIVRVTRYVHDDEGVLHSVSLPDGSRIEYDRNGQGEVLARMAQGKSIESAALKAMKDKPVAVVE